MRENEYIDKYGLGCSGCETCDFNWKKKRINMCVTTTSQGEKKIDIRANKQPRVGLGGRLLLMDSGAVFSNAIESACMSSVLAQMGCP